MKIIVITYVYPPTRTPRSIQIGRLLGALRYPVQVFCSRGTYLEDETLLPPGGSVLPGETRIRRRFWEPLVDSFQFLLNKDLLYRPDRFRRWSERVGRRILKDGVLDTKTDVVVTFGSPMSCHLAGLKIKQALKIPWVAHFSDPWADNPLSNWGACAKKVAVQLEKEVVAAADRVVFPAEETLELVMKKYPEVLRNKARVLSHCFDPLMPAARPTRRKSKLVLRHLGDFYTKRTPEPLFASLLKLFEHDALLLSNVVFELIGSVPTSMIKNSTTLSCLPQDLVQIRPPVPYRRAMELMVEADALMLIDAPVDPSPFLPSKLIDYIGADRPILGFSPNGPSRRVIQSLGGWVVDPRNSVEGAEQISALISFLRRTQAENSWAPEGIRNLHSPKHIAFQFESILGEVTPCAES